MIPPTKVYKVGTYHQWGLVLDFLPSISLAHYWLIIDSYRFLLWMKVLEALVPNGACFYRCCWPTPLGHIHNTQPDWKEATNNLKDPIASATLNSSMGLTLLCKKICNNSSQWRLDKKNKYHEYVNKNLIWFTFLLVCQQLGLDCS